MINLSTFNLNLKKVKFGVFTNDIEKRMIKVKNELPPKYMQNLIKKKSEAKTSLYQKFKLKPNNYIFRLILFFKEINVEKVELSFKIGSMSDCSFEEHIDDGI